MMAKWNLIGRIQFKHVKNCLMFMSCNDWVCSDRTLNVVFLVRKCKLLGFEESAAANISLVRVY